jgi:tRNA pseudouridine38-40 synthase
MKENIIRTFKLTVAYDGTNYSGWQIQPEEPTVQGELKRVISTITCEDIRITGAGRTDTGVHAEGQVASFSTEVRMTTGVLKTALNSLLPDDIYIKDVEEVDNEFHPRKDARLRWYRYIITRKFSPFTRNYKYYFNDHLNIELMKESAEKLMGEHDFSAFTVDADEQKTERALYELSITESGNDILLDFKSLSFLRRQIRLMVSTLIKAGQGKIKPDDIPNIFKSRDNTRPGPPSPPYGLYLMEINYDKDLDG